MVILFHTNNTLLATDLNENKGPSSTGSSPGQGPKSKVSQVAQPAQWRRPSCWEGDKEADKSKYTDKQEFHKQRNLQLAFMLVFKIIQRQKNNTHGQIIQSKCLGTPHNPSCLYQSNCSDLTFLLHIHDVVFSHNTFAARPWSAKSCCLFLHVTHFEDLFLLPLFRLCHDWKSWQDFVFEIRSLMIMRCIYLVYVQSHLSCYQIVACW